MPTLLLAATAAAVTQDQHDAVQCPDQANQILFDMGKARRIHTLMNESWHGSVPMVIAEGAAASVQTDPFVGDWKAACQRCPALCAAMRKWGTDKVRYAGAYCKMMDDAALDSARDLLEIGLGTLTPGAASSMHMMREKGDVPETYRPGASLRVWRDILPRLHVWGGDIMPDTQLSDERIRTFLFDSLNRSSAAAALHGKRFDVVIEDGLHTLRGQVCTFLSVAPFLHKGGLYVFEDVQPTYAHLLVDWVSRGQPVLPKLRCSVGIFARGTNWNGPRAVSLMWCWAHARDAHTA